MGENTIDNLSIQISSNAGNAVNNINKLASSLSKVGSSAKNAASNGLKPVKDEMEDVAASSKEASRETKNFGKEAKDAGNSAKQGASGIERFLASLKRIMFYRVIRSVLRSISNAFKEGISNLYQWSAAVNGSFAKSMDRIATSTLYLKNSLGAMLAPIIERLAPVLEWIIDRIVDGINLINKLFAALSGSQTYTVAKKVATKWAETEQKVADSASSSLEQVKDNAKETVKELKKTILAFDEINKMEKQDEPSNPGGSGYGGGGGGGGGSSTPGTDYTSMFETRKLDGWMSKLAAFIAKLKAGVPAVLGAILAGWLLIKAAIKKTVEWLKKFWEKLKEIAGKVIDVPIRLIKWGWNSLKEWLMGVNPAPVAVGVTFAVTAAMLWKQLLTDWNAIPNRVLGFSFAPAVAIAIIAPILWSVLKKAWDSIPDKTLVMNFAPAIAFPLVAAALWVALKHAWDMIPGKVLGVGFAPSLGYAAAALVLFAGLALAWAKSPKKSLNVSFEPAMTAASDLKKKISEKLALLGAIAVGVHIVIKTKLNDLRKALETNWQRLGTWALGVKAKIVTAAEDLKSQLVTGWIGLTAWSLGVKTKIATKAEELKRRVITGWAALATWDLSVNVKPEFAADGNTAGVQGQTWYEKAWNWIQSHWKTVAAVGLGVAVAVTLATTAPALAGMVSTLWAKAVALLGGGLAISVVPGLAESSDPYYGSGSQYTQEWYDKHIKPIETEVTVNAVPGTGTKSGQNGKIEIDTLVKLVKSGWSTIVDWCYYSRGGDIKESVELVKKGWTFIDKWAQLYKGGKLNQSIALVRTGWTLISSWVNGYKGGTVKKEINLKRDGWTSVGKWVEGYTGTPVSQGIDLFVNNWYGFLGGISNALHSWFPTLFAEGGVIQNGHVSRFANGGYINAYAGGTSSAHGSLFLAGERGPEIVGHVGGRTEVLNKSQLAATMYEAVRAAMSGITIDANITTASAFAGTSDDSYMLAEYVRSGVQDATHQQNELLREQNNILRQLLDKPVTAEISTNGIINGLIRKNMRDGTTIVPVNG